MTDSGGCELRDALERERILKERLAESEKERATLEAVLFASTARLAYWDTKTCNAFANRAFLDAFGYEEKVVGQHASEVVRDSVDAPLWAAALRGEPQRVARTIESGGKTRHVVVTFEPDVRDGEVHGFVSTESDITELHTALVLSEQRNDLLMMAEEVARIGHWRFDVATSEIYWSPQMYKIHGRDPATFHPGTGPEILAAYHPDDRKKVHDFMATSVSTREPFEFVHRLYLPNGELRQVESKGRCEVDPETGTTRTLFGIYQDVTERNRERETAARQERLVTAGTLAAGVGHEINNPLMYVSANIDLALEGVRALEGSVPQRRIDDLLELLADSREGSERIRRIVRGLRAFSRPDAPLAPTDTRSALDISESMSGHELRSVATIIHEFRDNSLILADESRLAQVLVNLLVNAAQAFVTQDPKRNEIVVRTLGIESERMAIDISDNGPGIPADVLPRIFDPFFTTKDVGKGTGLGLSISHSIIASMGGELTCSTEVGAGTTFRITLPKAKDVAFSDTERVSAPPSTKRRRGRVLIVDGEPAVRRSIERVLGDEHEVVIAESSQEAIEIIGHGERAFDVVFCDIALPLLSGVELFRRIRDRDPALADRFVFMSGGVYDPEAAQFLDGVPNERIEKPFNSQNLRGLARRFAAARDD